MNPHLDSSNILFISSMDHISRLESGYRKIFTIFWIVSLARWRRQGWRWGRSRNSPGKGRMGGGGGGWEGEGVVRLSKPALKFGCMKKLEGSLEGREGGVQTIYYGWGEEIKLFFSFLFHLPKIFLFRVIFIGAKTIDWFILFCHQLQKIYTFAFFFKFFNLYLISPPRIFDNAPGRRWGRGRETFPTKYWRFKKTWTQSRTRSEEKLGSI